MQPQHQPPDWLDHAPIGCTIQLAADGTLTLHRSPGCTPDDVRDLCSVISHGDVNVIDLTESTIKRASMDE